MSSIDIAVACALLAVASLYFIFNVRPDASDSTPHRTKLDQLMERRDAIYENLRDLRFEYRAGKFSEADYEETKHSLEVDDLGDTPEAACRGWFVGLVNHRTKN